MMIAVLIAGIGVLLAGILAIGSGIPIKEFGFGNTLIISGAVAACTGAMMLVLWIVVRELKNIARRLGPDVPADSRGATTLIAAVPSPALGNPAPLENTGNAEPSAQSPQPWHEEAALRDRARVDVPGEAESAEAVPAAKPKRNLLFSSTSRKERERAQARTGEPAAADLRPAPAAPAFPATPPAAESAEAPETFDDAWPKPERARTDAPLPRRGARTPSTVTEAGSGAAGAERHPAEAQKEEQPPVTVLKSGVVDGMAYSLYSDGSIEAQMPEGMMRFASIDELRAHLDQRP
jgi:hypothetical protein